MGFHLAFEPQGGLPTPTRRVRAGSSPQWGNASFVAAGSWECSRGFRDLGVFGDSSCNP